MKRTVRILIWLGLVLGAAGCGSTQDASQGTVSQENTEQGSVSQENAEAGTQVALDGVDYDLTAMSSDMVYATVYQMMADPDSYIGKTFCMDGLYYAAYDEASKQYYHYCLIQDAASCCAQGLEFVWDDGSHVYPDEYPEENEEVTVQGVFETYQEEGDSNLYCRLKDAALVVGSN